MKSNSKLIIINLPLSFVCETHVKWETVWQCVFIRNIKWSREIEWRLKTEQYIKSHVFYSSLLIWLWLDVLDFEPYFAGGRMCPLAKGKLFQRSAVLRALDILRGTKNRRYFSPLEMCGPLHRSMTAQHTQIYKHTTNRETCKHIHVLPLM